MCAIRGAGIGYASDGEDLAGGLAVGRMYRFRLSSLVRNEGAWCGLRKAGRGTTKCAAQSPGARDAGCGQDCGGVVLRGLEFVVE